MAVRHKKIAVVTGGSSGIGRCTAASLRDKGYLVYEFSRRHIPISGVNHLSVDVTDEEMVTSAIHHIMKAEAKIDAVVNCAGFGISGAVEFTTTEQAKSQFDVNFFGTVNVNKAVLPVMHQQGSGHIVNISSVAATAHIPFQTFYSASKAAVSSYSYALANEVSPYGIYVTTVELGDIRTGFTKSRQKNILGDKDYDGRISRSVSRMEHDEQNGRYRRLHRRYRDKKETLRPLCGRYSVQASEPFVQNSSNRTPAEDCRYDLRVKLSFIREPAGLSFPST